MLLWFLIGFFGGLLVFGGVAAWWLSRIELWR